MGTTPPLDPTSYSSPTPFDPGKEARPKTSKPKIPINSRVRWGNIKLRMRGRISYERHKQSSLPFFRSLLSPYIFLFIFNYSSTQSCLQDNQNTKMTFKTTATIASFGGKLLKLTHNASTVGCEMALNLYLPPKASVEKKVPVIFYLAGLTCTGDNGAEKGFFQSAASERGIAVVYPDTSPSKFFLLQGEKDKGRPLGGRGLRVIR